jgi:uncharacterized membrane protein YdbT with pleckstrin-like domain
VSYVSKVLLPGEQVIYEAGLHWLIYGRAIVLFVIALGLWVAAQFVPQGTENTALGQNIVLGLAALVFVLAVLAAAAAAIRRGTTELAVTDQRVIYKRGIFARHTIEMNRSKVESVDVDQSLLGRIFGYGTIVVRGTGGSLEPMRDISHPLDFRSTITAR